MSLKAEVRLHAARLEIAEISSVDYYLQSSMILVQRITTILPLNIPFT